MTKTATPSNNIASIFTDTIVGVPYELRHPGDGSELGLRLFLRSVNDDEIKPITRKIENERLRLERTRQGGFKADQLRANSIEIISHCITGWEWYEVDGVLGDFNGEQLPFTPANLKKILEIDRLRAQVDTELADESRFFQN